MRPIRVVVDARLPARGWGGVQQVVMGLAAGLTSIDPADLQITYLCFPDGRDWLIPYTKSDEGFRIVKSPSRPSSAKTWASRNLPGVRRAYHALVGPPPVPRSDGVLEALGPDIVHFPHQGAFLTGIRSIYVAHDIQHLHLPHLFSRREIAMRESYYRAFCSQASLVVMATSWARDDIIRAYGLSPDKVAVIPWASVVDLYPQLTPADLEELQRELRIPTEFCFYPAQTWPHKNHERLLRAVAQLRLRDGLTVPLVFSGYATPYRDYLLRVVKELELVDAVRWVGFVEPRVLNALYRMARCVVLPSLFEGANLPIFEALGSGVPIACSNVTSNPRQVRDAAILFDPLSVDEIALAIKRLWTDHELRALLVERGKSRIAGFSWERTARHFAAYYRFLLNRELSQEDHAILLADPIT